MIVAYTLAKVTPNKNVFVAKKLENMPLVTEVILIYGEYDILVKTKTKDIEELHNFIYDFFRKMPHITTTTTMIVAKIPKKVPG